MISLVHAAYSTSPRIVSILQPLLDKRLKKSHPRVSGHNGWVRSVCWSPDGKRLASGSDDKTVRIFEAATGKELSTLRDDKV